MEVRHNTALLEQALALVVQRASIPSQQAEAEAAERIARAVARRRIATGVAIAVAAVGLGLGIQFGLWRLPSEGRVVSLPPAQSPSPAVPAPIGKSLSEGVSGRWRQGITMRQTPTRFGATPGAIQASLRTASS